VSINQKRIGNISRNNRKVINIDIVNIIDQIDSLSLRGIGWLNNPNVLFRVSLSEFLVFCIEFSEFVWENVGIWDEIEIVSSIFFLHSDNITAHSVFTSDFVTLREVVYLLVLI